MLIETSVADFKAGLGVMLKQVQCRHDSIVINKDGKPVAVLVDVASFERIQRMASRFDSLCARVEAGFAKTLVVESAAEIDAACKAVRSQLRVLE